MKNKKILWLFLIIFCLLVAIIIIFSLLKFKQIIFNNKNQVNNTPGLDKANEFSDNQIYDMAFLSGKEDLCRTIKDEKIKDYCYSHIAQKGLKLEVCSLIGDQIIKSDCSNFVLNQEAEINKKLSFCSQITGIELRNNCFLNNIKEGAELKDCENLNFGDNKNEDFEAIKNFCRDAINFALAGLNKNLEDCNKISNLEIKARCYGKVLNVPLGQDLDKDGLNYRDEIMQGSDPAKADTDGDGFNDGEEVKNGYSPVDGN